jgi:branched-chain amino acid transport system permease protein
MPTRPLVTRYEDDLALFPDRWHWVGVVATILGILLFGMLANDYWISIGNNALIAVVGSVAMMVLTGFAGQVSLGHAAFIAIGAYTAAILGLSFGLPFWLCIPISGILAALVGLMIGPFALRLEGLYLAIVTIGLMFLVQHVLRNGLDMAYGKDYLSVPMHSWFVEPGSDSLGSFRMPVVIGAWKVATDRVLYALFVVLAMIALWMGKNLQRSNTGRAMMAVRDGELAAGALGVDATRAKLTAFGISSFLAGVAGAMYAFAHPVLTLEPFGLKMSVEYIAMVVLGGVGTMFGAAWGALAFTVLHPIAELIGGLLPFPSGFSSEHQSVLLFFPTLCIFLVFEPFGLLGIWLRVKRYFLAWPFRY